MECAKQLGYFADFNRLQAWVGLSVSTTQKTELLFSFHGIGREQAGILGVSGMIYTKSEDQDGSRYITHIKPVVNEPFEFAYAEPAESVMLRFESWLEDCVATGFEWWQNQL